MKKDIKLLLFTDDMIVYTEIQKNQPKNLKELVSDYSGIVGYKVKTQSQSVSYMLTMNKCIWNEKHKTIYINTPQVKYLDISLINMHKNYMKKLMKSDEQNKKRTK